MVCISNSYSLADPLSGMIVLEGVNGAGKSSLQKRIGSYLEQEDFHPFLSREPGAGAFGALIREILLSEEKKPSCPLSELFLFNADRAEHVHTLLKPALAEKKPVILDRYFYSTLAFQGYGRNIPLDHVEPMVNLAIQGLLPDLVILLDLDPRVGLERNRKDNQEEAEDDQFEHEALSFHNRLRNGFLTLAEERPEPFFVIDAAQSPEAIDAALFPLIDTWIQALKENWHE